MYDRQGRFPDNGNRPVFHPLQANTGKVKPQQKLPAAQWALELREDQEKDTGYE